MMTQRQIADFFGTTVANINLHLSSMYSRGLPVRGPVQRTNCIEGKRTIRREVLHYPISVVFGIATKAHSSKVTEIQKWASTRRIRLDRYICIRYEHSFSELLRCLDGLVTVIPQKSFDKYRVDFFVPELSLAIEYDEPFHRLRSRSDAKRERQIVKKHEIDFLRVRAGEEIRAINRIIRMIVSNRPMLRHRRSDKPKSNLSFV